MLFILPATILKRFTDENNELRKYNKHIFKFSLNLKYLIKKYIYNIVISKPTFVCVCQFLASETS